jgi:hypothetical protein
VKVSRGPSNSRTSYSLQNSVGEIIVILDAGGGTIDAVTYEVTGDDPPRMSAEVVEANSKRA